MAQLSNKNNAKFEHRNTRIFFLFLFFDIRTFGVFVLDFVVRAHCEYHVFITCSTKQNLNIKILVFISMFVFR